MVKKILYIMSNEPVGGVGTVVKNYQSHFHREKIKIDFIIFDPREDTPFNRTVKEMGAAVYTFPLLSLKNIVKIIILLQKFYKAHQGEYEIVHVHSPNIAWMCFWRAEHYGIKYRIVHSHSTLYSNKKIKAIRNKILCVPIKYLANIYMACSKAAGEFLYGKKNINKVIVVRNAIDCSKYRYDTQTRKRVRKELKLENKIVIGHVGHFNKEKNHTFLIDIFEQALQMRQDIVLVLAGEGSLKEFIIKKVKEKGLEEKVLFLGIRNDVNELLQAMDVLMLPSLFEGVPVTGIEAQAAGLPCIMSTNVSEEFNVGFISYLDLSESPKIWAEKIFEQYGSTDRMKGAELVAKAGYDINIEAGKLEKFYLQLYDKGEYT